MLHLHHLTPIHEAAARVAPDVPVVGHLHGTELLMLEEIEEGPPEGWDHAEAWAERMRRWAERCERLVLLSETQRERAERLLGVDAERCVVLPNGFDPETLLPPRRRPRRALEAPPRRRAARLAPGRATPGRSPTPPSRSRASTTRP